MSTRRLVVLLAACVVPQLVALGPAGAFEKEDQPALVGDWRGSSTCVVRPGNCRDEDSLYHVTRMENNPGRFSMQGDKIMDGKPVAMGTVECGYDPEKRSLHFEVSGDVMQETMRRSDGSLWRKLSLARVR